MYRDVSRCWKFKLIKTILPQNHFLYWAANKVQLRNWVKKILEPRLWIFCYAKVGSVFGWPQSLLGLQIWPLVNTDGYYHNQQLWPLVCNQLNQGLFTRRRLGCEHVKQQDYTLFQCLHLQLIHIIIHCMWAQGRIMY